jgi:ribonucleoside-diphosphate reductase alpha chain
MINLENYKDTPDFMTEEGIKTLRSGYLGKDESIKQMYYRVVTSAVNHLEGIRNIDPQLEQRLFDYLYNNWLCLSSPIIMNAGKEKGLPISCYVIPLEDNIYAINHGTTEMAMLTKNGGGVGVSWDNVRAKGTPISFSGAHSEGVIPFMKQYDSTILATSQGSMRRGAASANLSINHGDWEDFIKMRRPEGDENRRCQNLHHCTDIPDSFMETLPVNKQSLHKWAEAMSLGISL